MTARPRHVCPYCGRDLPGGRGGVDYNRDHIFAKQMFPRPVPNDLGSILVRSCIPCNTGFKKDEEYFVTIFSTYAGANGSGKLVYDRVRSTFAKNGPYKAVQRGFHPVELHSPAGLYVGPRWAVMIDQQRVDNVIGKWVRGFDYKAYGTAVGASDIQALMFDPAQGRGDHWGEPTKGVACWPGKFEYWYSRNADEPTQTRWSFLVWDVLGFFAQTSHTIDVAVIDLLKDPGGKDWVPS